MAKYNYDQVGALSITHFAPDAVTTACGAYLLDRRAAWTVEPDLVDGCPSCLSAATQDSAQADNCPPPLTLSNLSDYLTVWPTDAKKRQGEIQLAACPRIRFWRRKPPLSNLIGD